MERKKLSDAIEEIGFGIFHVRLIFALGLVLAGEAIEYFVISFIVPPANCEWHLSSFQSALMSIAFFMGLLCGSYIWGLLADKLGRQRCLIIAQFMAAYFGLLSAFPPNYVWFVILRGIVGVCIAGSIGTAYPLLVELSPISYRHIFYVVHPIGASLSAVVLYFVGSLIIPSVGWRPLVAVAALPSLIGGILVLLFVPRSPRFLLLMNQREEAERVLVSMATTNRLQDYTVTLEDIKTSSLVETESDFLALFDRSRLRLTVPILMMWFAAGFLHYSVVLFSTVLPRIYAKICPSNVFNFAFHEQNDTSCSSCVSAETVLLGPLVAGAMGEMASIFFPAVVAFWLGRRWSLSISAVILVVIFVIHIFCKSMPVLSLTLFFNRAASLGFFISCILYTTEAYPTSVRGTALGSGFSFTRLGNLFSPLAAQVYIQTQPMWQALLLLAIVAMVAAMLTPVLPFETRGRHLQDTFSEDEKGTNSNPGAKEKDPLHTSRQQVTGYNT